MRLRHRAIPVPGWVSGVVQDAEPGVLAPGTLVEGRNLVPTPAGRLRTRGGTRVAQTLHDDQATPAEISHVLALRPFTGVGALAIGWADAVDKHFAWRLEQDMAFATGSEATSRHDLTSVSSWANASAPGRPVMAEVFEKMYLADATETYGNRNTLVSIANDGTVTKPQFAFGAGAAAAVYPYCLEEYNGVLFIAGYGTEDAGDGDRPEYLRHSFLGRSPDAANGFDIDAWNLIGSKGQRITALRKGRGLLLVSKANEFYRVSGFGRAYAGWQYAVEAVDNPLGLGAANPNCLIYAEGSWWGVGDQGPFRTDGFRVDSLVGPRLRDWNGIDRPTEAWVSWHPERRLVLFGLHPTEASAGRSATYPWKVWAWDVDRQVWQPDWTMGADLFFASAVEAVSSATAAGSAAPSAPPSAPVTSGETTTGYTASWTNGDAAAETEFWEKEGSGGTWTLIDVIAAGTATYAQTGRTNHTQYYWKVRHRKNGIASDYTAETSAQTLIAAPGLAGEPDGAFAKLTITQNAGGTTVTVQRSPGGAGTWTTVITETLSAGDHVRFDDPGDGTWDYRARSSDAAWPSPDSAWSATVTVTIDTGGAI